MKNFSHISKKLLLIALLGLTANQIVFCMEQEPEKQGTKRKADELEQQQQEKKPAMLPQLLLDAISNKNIEKVKELINSGADVNALNSVEDRGFLPPIALALVRKDQSLDLITILLNAGVDLNAKIIIHFQDDELPPSGLTPVQLFVFSLKGRFYANTRYILSILINSTGISIDNIEQAIKLLPANSEEQGFLQKLLDEKITNAKKLYMTKPLCQSTTSKRC